MTSKEIKNLADYLIDFRPMLEEQHGVPAFDNMVEVIASYIEYYHKISRNLFKDLVYDSRPAVLGNNRP